MDATARLIIRGQTQGLTKAQAEINTLYRSAQADISKLTTNVAQFGHHSQVAFQIFKGLAIYRGFGMITQSLSEGVQAAIEFETAMANVNALLQVSDAQLAKYGDFIADLGQTLPLTMQELAEGMYDVVSAGFLLGDQIKVVTRLASTAAVAGATDLRSAVQAGVGTMNAFGKSVDDLEHIYNVHFNTVKMGILQYEQLNQVLGRVSATASLAGQQMETAFGAIVAISRGGFGGAAFEEGSTRVVRFFQELSDPSAQQKIKQLGVTVFDAFGKMRNAIDIVTDINVKLAVMTDEARQATIRQIFTNIRSAQGFEVLSKQVDIWREATMKGIFSADAMTLAAGKQTRTMAAEFKKMQNMFTSAMRDLMNFLSPLFKGLVTLFANMGKNMWPIIAMIGTLAMRFVTAGAAASYLNKVIMKQALQSDVYMAHLKLEDLVLQRRNQAAAYRNQIEAQGINIRSGALKTMHAMRHAMSAADHQMIKNIAAKQSDIQVTQGQIIAQRTLIQAAQARIVQLQYQKQMMFANIAGMMAMSGAMYGMATGNRELAQLMIGFAVAIQTVTMVMSAALPILAARTTTMTALAAATVTAAAGEAALSAGATSVAQVAGAAIVIGAIVGGVAALSVGAMDAAASVDGLSDSITGLEDSMEDMGDATEDFIKQLIRKGETLDTIKFKVRELAGAYDDFGVDSALALAKSGYAKVGGEEFFQVPTWAFPKTEEGIEGSDFQKGMNNILFTAEEISALWKGDADVFLRVQDELLAMEDIAYRNTLASMIYGDFGIEVLAVWDTINKKIVSVNKDSRNTVDYMERVLFQTRDKIRSETSSMMVELPGMISAFEKFELEKMDIPVMFRKAGEEMWTAFIQEADFSKVPGRLTTPTIAQEWAGIKPTTQEMTDDFREFIIDWMLDNDEVYKLIKESASRSVLLFENMYDGSQKMAMTAKGVIDYAKQWSTLGKAVGALEKVAGVWDTTGEKWKEIQDQWAKLDLINTFVTAFAALRDLPTLAGGDLSKVAEESLKRLDPVIQSTLEQLIPSLVSVFENLPLDDDNFWANAIQSDEVLSAAEEAYMEMADAVVSGVSTLDDFIETLIGAGDRLDDAGYYFGDVAGQWGDIGIEWAKVQKVWMGLQVVQSILSIVTDMATAAGQMFDTVTEEVITGYETKPTERALESQEWLAKYHESTMARIAWLTEHGFTFASEQLQITLDKIIAQASETYQEAMIETITNLVPTGEAADIIAFQQQITSALLPILQSMTGTAAQGLIDVLRSIFGNLGDESFWDVVFDDMESAVTQTFAEMADEFSEMISGASGFGSAIDDFVEHSAILESAGYYWKGVAGNWMNLGEEWARIQSYFKVTEMINTFIQSAKAMKEYGVALPETFQENMYALMQVMATQVLPDFQNVIDGLLDNIGSEGFWEALADGMANAQITQSNSIVLAPYIVIDHEVDGEEVTQLVHDALVDEAKRAGFSWGG